MSRILFGPNLFAVFGLSPESILDSYKSSAPGNGKNKKSGAKSSIKNASPAPQGTTAARWLNLSQLEVSDEPESTVLNQNASSSVKKQMKLTFCGSTAPPGGKTLTIVLDNITFVYRPDGVYVDKYVHSGAVAASSADDFLFGFRVAGGTKNNSQLFQIVNHLGSYVPDAVVVLKLANRNNKEAVKELDRLLSLLAPPLLSKLHDPAIQHLGVTYDSAPTSSPGFFKTLARTLVSRAKKRFTEGNFNLDLAYITSHCLAMGFPVLSDDVEANFRNDMADVFRFFATRHRENYWVLNLCSERAFPPSCFGGRFSRLPFEDHEAPPIELLFDLCRCMELFLATGRPMVASINSSALAPFLSPEERAAFWRRNPPNAASEDLPAANGRMVAVHCKAGKGRTGVSLSAWIYYERLMRAVHHNMTRRDSPVPLPDVEDCARLFGEKRSQDGSGVTIVSQMRFLRYFSRCCSELGMQLPPTIRPVKIHAVTINFTPALDGRGGAKLFVIVRTLRKPIVWERMGRREWLGRGMKVSASAVSNSFTPAEQTVPSNPFHQTSTSSPTSSNNAAKKNANGSSTTSLPPPMSPIDPVTLQTVADSRKIELPEWVVGGGRITIPLGDVEVEDEFHISVWHTASPGETMGKMTKKTKNKGDDDDDDDEDDDGNEFDNDDANNGTVGSSSSSAAATAIAQKLILHGAGGEYMACACWLHSSFLELPDPENDEDPEHLGGHQKTAVTLGLRQLDGCSKGKAIELFEEDFSIEILMSACTAKARVGGISVVNSDNNKNGDGEQPGSPSNNNLNVKNNQKNLDDCIL